MQKSSRLILSNDLGEFFRQEVTDAKGSLGIKLSDSAEFYLVNLLCDFSRQGSAPAVGEEPLALLYKRALEASAAERVQLLKNLGDLALYVSGFFTEFIERSLVDVDYYIAMGGNAYGSLASLVGGQRHGATFGELYLQLARKFTELVDLLNQIAERTRDKAESDAELLKLYDRWVRTGSQRIQKLLLEKGLLPTEGLPTDYVQ